jgi:hypothetical protein
MLISTVHLKLHILALVLLAALSIGMQPSSAQEQIRLETSSDQGTFLVVIMWEPNEIGTENTFTITFIEPVTGSVLEDIQYDFAVRSEETGDRTVRRVDQISTVQRVTFAEEGWHVVSVEDIEGLGENASVPIQVTPEFPSLITIVATAAMGAALALAKFGGANLFRRR